MRKVKNNIHTNNPAVMFAQGLESLISDPMFSPSRHDADELQATRLAATKPDSRGNLFNILLSQFVKL